jgi:hypothetical protein
MAEFNCLILKIAYLSIYKIYISVYIVLLKIIIALSYFPRTKEPWQTLQRF